MNWTFWLELIVRSGLLLLAGIALLRLSRSSTAAFRHRLVLSLFILLALLPALSLLLPEIPLSFWSSAPDHAAEVSIQQLSSRALEVPAHAPINWLLAIWLTGFIVACIPLLAGLISAWRINHAAQVGNPPILISTQLSIPITCGLFHPRIILPKAAETWTPTRVQAVLLHESAHIRRHDLPIQLFTHLIAALWWFQPLVWILRRRLRAESELACDAEAIHSGIRPSQYAEELLEVAKSIQGSWRLSSSALGMARNSGLEQRLRAILTPPAASLPRHIVYAICIILGAASITASSVTLDSYQHSEPGGSAMKRTITSALLTSAGLSAATVGGYIHDANGSAIANAKVSIYTPGQSAKQEAVTASDGKFALSLAEGQYILRVEKPGFASIFRVFDLQPDSQLNRDFTMSQQGAATIADSSVIPVDPRPKHIRVGGQVAESNLVEKVQPVYPASAKQARVQGTVELDLTITKEGVPLDLRVVSSPSDDLSESAVEAVQQWRYRPTLLNGQPVEIETTVVVHYTLSQ